MPKRPEEWPSCDPKTIAHGSNGPIIWHITTSPLYPGKFLLHANVRSMFADGYHEGDQAGAEDAANRMAAKLKADLIAMLHI